MIEVWAHSDLPETLGLKIIGTIDVSTFSNAAKEMISSGILTIHTNISANELRDLVEGSIGTIFYSYGEGWGQPLAESLCCGKKVVCNDLEVFHEVLGEWGLFFPTNSPEMVIPQLQKLFEDKEKNRNQADQIKNFAKRYMAEGVGKSWQEVLDNLVNNYLSENL